MRFKLYIVPMVTFMCIVSFARAKKLCDVRKWYLNIITDDVFNLDLTKEQYSLKYSIESLVLKSSESKETRMVDCSVLYMYNEMLLDLFNYIPSGSGLSLTEIETEEQSIDGLKSDNVKAGDVEGGEEEQTEYEKMHDETELSEITENSIHNVIETDEARQNVIESENKWSRQNLDDTEIKPTETESKIEEHFEQFPVDKEDIISTKAESALDLTTANIIQLHVPDSESGNLDSEEKVITYDSNYIQTDETDHFFSTVTHDHFENNAESIDETQVLENAMPAFTMSSDSSEEVVTSKPTLEVNQSDKENYKNEPIRLEDVFVSNSIPFGVCWSFGCLVSDIFDVYGRGMDGYSSELEDKNKLSISNTSSNKKKYKFECPLGPVCTMRCFYIFLCSNSFCMKDSTYISFQMKENEEHTMHKHLFFEAVNTDAISETKDLKAENMSRRKGKQNTFVTDDESFKHVTTINDKSKWTVTEFENIVEQKTSKYYSKLQTIEVMIMKLENQLLMETLNKQNHSSTITKLENQILRLENELLKMNKNYQNLREESLSMSKRQHKYLELAYKKTRNEYPKLTDRSNVKYELISQHQAKINELTEVLRNQSGIVTQLKEKYDTLEEQNRKLQQMVMNQTLFMTSIMKSVHDLTVQNMRNQQEINNLKRELEKNVGEETYLEDTPCEKKKDVIEQLDSLLFNNRVQKIRADDNMEKEIENEDYDIHDTEQTINHDMNNYFENQSTYTIMVNWCHKDNTTCPSCYYKSIIKSQCTPFQNIIWSKCKTEQKVTESDFPSVPFVKDEQTNSIIDDLETGTSYNEVKQATSNGHLNSIPKDNSFETNDDQDSIDGKNLEGFNENKEFDKYIIVGYDRDGKPVLKIRDDVDKEKLFETKEENIDSLNTESVNESNEKQKEIIDKAVLSKDENMIKTQQPREIPIYSEDDNLKEVKEANEQVQLQIQDLISQADTRNINMNTDKGDVTSEVKNIGGGQDRTFQANSIKQIDTVDKGVEKEINDIDKGSLTAHPTLEKSSDNSDKNIAVSKGSSDNQKDNLSSKYNEPKDETKKNDLVKSGKAKNDLHIVRDDEKLHNTMDLQQVSTSNVKLENKGAQKAEQKIPNTESKQLKRMNPINLNKNKQNEPKDCYDHYNRGERKDGLFKVKPLGSDKVIEVFCDMRRGGWTVIQRRQDGTINFFQEWDDYKRGFGGLYGEHWLGNDNIHLLTNQDYYKLRVDLMDWEKNKKYAEFEYFLVEHEDEAYKLHIDSYTGDAGDGLTKHSGSKFSTKDVDNDKVVKEFGGSCANRFYGAGWYFKCYASNLNGRFYKGGKIPEKRFDGITWKPWTGPNYSLKKAEMKIRPFSAD